MRLLACTIAALLSLACSSSAAAQTELRITLWPLGKGKGAPRTATLRCDPAGRALPAPVASDPIAAARTPARSRAGSACSSSSPCGDRVLSGNPRDRGDGSGAAPDASLALAGVSGQAPGPGRRYHRPRPMGAAQA